MIRVRLALLLAAIVIIPTALAGSESRPDVQGKRDRDDPSGDILAAWIEKRSDGVRFTVKLASLPAGSTSRVWSVELTFAGNRASPGIGLSGRGGTLTDSGDNPSGWGGSVPTVDGALLSPTIRAGSPAYVSATVPWGLYEGFTPDATVRLASADSAVFHPGEGWLASYDVEKASATSAFLPILVPAWVIPTVVVACTLAGAGAGLFLARRSTR